jgi:hypothetical protein
MASPQIFMPPLNPYMFSAPWFPPAPMASYGNPLAAFNQVPIIPQPAIATPQLLKCELPPSSPPDESAFVEPFPAIRIFLEGLGVSNPLRKLEIYADVFESNDYYGVDEIAGITYDRLTTDPFNMTPGNAEFLLKAIEREVKRVKRVREKDRKRARHH